MTRFFIALLFVGCNVCIIYRSMFSLPLGVIGRQCSVSVPRPVHLFLLSLTHWYRLDSSISIRSVPNRKVSNLFSLLLYFIKIPLFNANRVDPDQTPRSAASDLGLYCSPMSLLWNTRHKWVNDYESLNQRLFKTTTWNCNQTAQLRRIHRNAIQPFIMVKIGIIVLDSVL